jgi:hypothetical protein
MKLHRNQLNCTHPVAQPDKLMTLIKAANVEEVESIWTTLFAKVQRTGSQACRYNDEKQRLIPRTGT